MVRCRDRGGESLWRFSVGCGGGGGESEVAPPPEDPDAPATGTLRVFAYGDTVPDEMLDPFREANPDLDLKVATFDSNKAAAAKLAGGFEADVVEVCTDEMAPLLARGLIRPLDPAALPAFDQLAFSDSREVRNDAGEVLFVPASAGPHGPDRRHRGDPGGSRLLRRPLRSRVRGQRRARGDAADRDRVTAMALGLDDPMNLTDEEIEEAKQHLLDNRDNFRAFAESDSSMVNLFKSGEVVLADGGRGTTQAMVDDGLPVEWVAPQEGALSWVCGLAITSKAQNIDAAYKLINYYASPEAQAISGDMGFVAMNPDALPLVSRRSASRPTRATSRPRSHQTEPANAEVYERAWQEVLAQ